MAKNLININDILEAIRDQSARTTVGRRVNELEGMIELVEYLAGADYRVPAILYGFLRSEVGGLEHQKPSGS